jgi:hypothetical protein
MTAESSVSEAAEHLRGTAQRSVQKLAHDLEGGFGELRDAVQNEVRSHPVRSVLIAAGVGYALGGGLAAPLTRRLARLALRAMILPALEEPTARLWDWIRSDSESDAAPARKSSPQSTQSESTRETAAKGGKPHGN